MLGYVLPYKPEMKVKEADLYKAYYCGICKSIGRRYGQLPRFTLSYDAAFLAIMLDSLYDEKEYLVRERCIANPFKKKVIAYNEAIEFSADVMLILAWHNLRDDAEDEGKKTADVLSKLSHGLYEKIHGARPAFCNSIEEHLQLLKKVEKKDSHSIDEAAEAFAKIMEDIFREGTRLISKAHAMEAVYDELAYEDGDESITKEGVVNSIKIMARIGYHLGKWIYLMDAYDDIAKDVKSGAYNVLLNRFDYRQGEAICAFKNRIMDDVKRNLFTYLAEIAKAVDLLDIKKNKGIIENVIYVGLLKKTEALLDGKGEKENE